MLYIVQRSFSASFNLISPQSQHNLHSWTSLTHHLWHYHVSQSLVASLSVTVTLCLCLVCLACAFSLLTLRASLFVRSNDKNVFTLIEISCAAINRCQSQQYLLFFCFCFVQQNNEIEMQISINLCNCDRRRFSFLWVTWQALLLLLLLLSLREKWNSCDY